MGKYLVLTFLFAATAVAQTPTKPVDPTNEVTFQLGAKAMEIDPPKSWRDWALEQIKYHREYEAKKDAKFGVKDRGDSPELTYFSSMGGKESRASVSVEDGKVKIDGDMTMEDVLLVLIAEKDANQRSLEERWDRDEEARKQKVPDHVIVGGRKWPVISAPNWEFRGDGVLADTNCALRKIHVLDTDRNKPDSVMHELMHVASGCNPSPALHRFIYETSQGMVNILHDNPEIADYFVYGSHQRPCPAGGCDDGWVWEDKGYACVRGDQLQPPSKKSCKELGLVVGKWPTSATMSFRLDPVQAKEQDHPVPLCSDKSAQTSSACEDPDLRHIIAHIYQKKENCERDEAVKCESWFDGNQERWVPIGKPVFEDKTEAP